jgi:ferredoxin
MKVQVDDSKCTGHGRCYTLVPDIFEDDDQGHSVVTQPLVEGVLREQALRAQRTCPEGAVLVSED